MGEILLARQWETLKLPNGIIKLIDAIIEENYMGYRNRSDFTVDAIRRRLEEIEKLKGIIIERPK